MLTLVATGLWRETDGEPELGRWSTLVATELWRETGGWSTLDETELRPGLGVDGLTDFESEWPVLTSSEVALLVWEAWLELLLWRVTRELEPVPCLATSSGKNECKKLSYEYR